MMPIVLHLELMIRIHFRRFLVSESFSRTQQRLNGIRWPQLTFVRRLDCDKHLEEGNGRGVPIKSIVNMSNSGDNSASGYPSSLWFL
jgi:hypothetical protein